MKRETFYLVAGFAYLAFFGGASYESIGEFSKVCSEPYPWEMPLIMVGFAATPSTLFYLAGRART